MDLIELEISKISTGERLRASDNDYVELLAASIQERGLTNPITVSKADRNGVSPLLAGMHRLEAVKMLGWETIPAVVDPSEGHLQQKLVEIDENLFRRELSAMDRAVFLQQRQEIYEILHPETRAGFAGAYITNATGNPQTTTLSFAEKTAEKLGLSPRSIQRSVQRAKRIAPEVRAYIGTSWIANSGKELDALAKLPPAEQINVVIDMLKPEDPPKSVKAAIQARSGKKPPTVSPEEQQMAALQNAWAKASAKTQKQFIALLKEMGAI